MDVHSSNCDFSHLLLFSSLSSRAPCFGSLTPRPASRWRSCGEARAMRRFIGESRSKPITNTKLFWVTLNRIPNYVVRSISPAPKLQLVEGCRIVQPERMCSIKKYNPRPPVSEQTRYLVDSFYFAQALETFGRAPSLNDVVHPSNNRPGVCAVPVEPSGWDNQSIDHG